MSDKWDFRSVEGALYSLGRPADARVAQSRPSQGTSSPAPRSGLPSRQIVERADFTLSIQRSLSADEVADLKDHYILGVRQLRGRSGYRRRAEIIKKLVDRLNDGSE